MEPLPPGGGATSCRGTRGQVRSDKERRHHWHFRRRGCRLRAWLQGLYARSVSGSPDSGKRTYPARSRTQFAMPKLSYSVSQAGLEVPVLIGLDGQEITDLLAAGQSVPAPILIRGLLDTGSDVAAV